MGNKRTRRLGALVAIGAAALTLSTAASAGLIFQETFHEEGPLAFEDFCEVSGLDVEGGFTVDGRVRAVTHGRDGLVYFMEHLRSTTVLTNPDTDKSITEVVTVLQKDLKVTDNGDGRLTILVLATGNAVVYGADGKAVARNPGQVRFAFIVNHGGTPDDPEDDVFVRDLGLVKGSTGRTDDFCEAVVPALS